MTRTSFYDPNQEATVEGVLKPGWDVPDLVHTILGLTSGRGHPAAELLRDDGSLLSIGTDGTWAVLNWRDPLGDDLQSVGSGAEAVLVYDYYGSRSEAPVHAQVAFAHALEAAEQFAAHGSPVTEWVLFVPD